MIGYILQLTIQYTNIPQTELLTSEEVAGSYPYARQELSCYKTTNVLRVDLSQNQVCVDLERLVGSNCSQFPYGVLYDVMFNNHVTWRSQQRDYQYYTTNSFCFPCYGADCSFITATTIASMRINSEIYVTQVQISAIVIQKSNQSDCFDSSLSALRRSSTHQMLKLSPKPGCKYVFDDCVMTKLFEQKYRDKLTGTESTVISSAEWDVIKVPQTDSYGQYYKIEKNSAQNIDDGQLYSIFTISYQCPLIEMQHTVKINYISSFDYPNFGQNAVGIIEQDYIGFQLASLNPGFTEQVNSNVVITVMLTSTVTSEIVNVLEFSANSFNFKKSYVYCSQITSILTSQSSDLIQDCKDLLHSYSGQVSTLNALFSFKFNGIFATQLITSIKTGCWDSIQMSFNSSHVCVSTNPVPECILIREQKSKISINLFQNGAKDEIASKTMYYSSEGTRQVCSICDSECQRKTNEQNVLFTVQSLEETENYSEMWILYVKKDTVKADNGILIIAGITAASFIAILAIIEGTMSACKRYTIHKKKQIKIHEIQNEDIE
ncbi:Conserved_hypothetical protein [Hexamita inflata]|uniref:Uncharacterized protein n=1 Tax=Hexamita inflata TaxID=28002 RepID=A0AA86QRX3_9EUKA|nr:Conserved hypothetical protein [Hexamita inflata]